MTRIVSLKQARRKRRKEALSERFARPLRIAAVVAVIAILAIVAWFWRPVVPTAANAVSETAAAIPVCKGNHRAARKLTCIVDGDTGWEKGRKWRALAIDAPEMPGHSSCSAEARKAVEARDRLRALMASGYTIDWTSNTGFYGRALVTIRLADGRDAGAVLVKAHLAQPWPNEGNVWCSR